MATIVEAPGENHSNYIARVHAKLTHWLPEEQTPPQTLHRAMRYAVLGDGKRLRPLLVYATGEVLGVDAERLDGPAGAVELIHAYSLVHDDLPAMDDDDLRRGKPACHKAFGEATAILVGDALQALAFFLLAGDPGMGDDPDIRARSIATLAGAAGSCGMAGGQAFDLAAEGQKLSLDELQRLHRHKTGALLRACVLLACDACPDLAADRRAALDQFAQTLGLAFQIRDDILDVEGNTEILGKTQGADQAHAKATYPALLGLLEAKAQAESLYRQALELLAPFGDNAKPLAQLAATIVNRNH